MRLVTIAAAFAALTLAGAASAADAPKCLQDQLAARGLYAGPTDATLSPTTLTAAAAFAKATAFPMPALTAATADEWCAVLTGWERRSRVPFPDRPGLAAAVAPYRNPDPAALPIGIRFRDDVPMATRKIIMDDLAWLARLGPLSDSGHLTAMLGLPTQITGADLVGWFAQNILAIGGGKVCPRREVVIRPAAGQAWQLAESFNLYCEPLDGVDAFVEAPTIGAEAGVGRIVYVGNEVLAAATPHESAPTINVVIGDRDLPFDPSADITSITERIYRLAILAHEASHTLRDGDQHIACDDVDYLFASRFDVGYFGAAPATRPAIDCDTRYGAYATETFVLETLAASCGCSSTARQTLLRWAAETAALTVIRLDKPWTVPSTPELAATRLAGRKFDALPMQPFFDLQLKLAETTRTGSDCSPTTRCFRVNAQATALGDLVATTFAAPSKFRNAWTMPEVAPVPVDTDWGMVWLARAMRAADTGYNVPLQWLTPCASSPIGCESAWVKDMPTLKPGVQSPTLRLTSSGDARILRTTLPNNWRVGGGTTREVRISVQEATGKPVTATLQCGDRRAVFVPNAPQRGKQTFSTLDCYVAVWTYRGTTAAEFSVLVDLATNPALAPMPAPTAPGGSSSRRDGADRQSP